MATERVDEEALRATTDVTVWAGEFARFFDGWQIDRHGADDEMSVNEGTLITWFANYAQAVNDQLRSDKQVHPGTWHAFLHFYYLDCSNAAIHTSGVRFSPITFRLAEFMLSEYSMVRSVRYDGRIAEVLTALGQYPEDKGRADEALTP